MNGNGTSPMDMPVNRAHVARALRYVYPMIPQANGIAYIDAVESHCDEPHEPEPRYLKSGGYDDDALLTLARQQTFLTNLKTADTAYEAVMRNGRKHRMFCAAVRHEGQLIGTVALLADGFSPESVMAVRVMVRTIEAMLMTRNKNEKEGLTTC